MTAPGSNQEIYDQLMRINEQAFGQGYYEVAYHALAAALHCALLMKGQALLTALEQRAREQRDWIDTAASGHALSSQSAALHGHVSIYTSLLKQIQARQLMLRVHFPDP
jgi:hypothetical protein